MAARELAKRMASIGLLVPTGLFHTTRALEPTVLASSLHAYEPRPSHS